MTISRQLIEIWLVETARIGGVLQKVNQICGYSYEVASSHSVPRHGYNLHRVYTICVYSWPGSSTSTNRSISFVLKPTAIGCRTPGNVTTSYNSVTSEPSSRNQCAI